MEKILIVGSSTIDKMALAEKIISYDENLHIASMFTSDDNFKDLTIDNNINHIYYNSNDNINLDYKNNALLYITCKDYLYNGVTLDEYNRSDIVILNLEDFNSISDKILKQYPIVIIWVDEKINKANPLQKHNIQETNYLMKRINKYPYMYFLNENIFDICNTIIKYISADSDEVKQNIISENN